MKYDFGGWVTRNDILCTDGRTIRKDAFKHCDGNTVPLVWNHQHNDPENVLGQVKLQNREEGVYGYASFNETKKAQSAKLAVMHGDVDSLSIYANHLKQDGGNVLHGDIKEVSLVLAGANSGAHIEEVIRHGEFSDDEAVIYPNEIIDLELEHEDKEEESAKEEKDENEETVRDVFESLTEKQKNVVYYLIAQAQAEAAGESDETEEAEHADKEKDDADDEEDESVRDVFNTLTKKQKDVVYALIAAALADKEAKHSDESDEAEESEEAEEAEDENQNDSEDTEGGNEMKHNLFEGTNEETEVLSHAEQEEIINEAKKSGSLRDAVLAHSITNIGNIYPDYKDVQERPRWITENQAWVNKVINGVHHTPFSRIKTVFADLTANDARAKGYLTKGTQKIEEVISLLKRETTPTTVYKLQKLDRDDLADITDFDSVAWLKEEMKVKLYEELARAYLIGDGRGVSAQDKINEEKIRPIWTMEELFAIQATYEVASDATADAKAKALIKAAVKGFDTYEGSGATVAFVAPSVLSDMLLLEDSFGHRLYKSKAEIASAMLVDEVIAVPPMAGKTRTVTISNVDHTRYLAGIIVDLRDYNVGMTNKGQINWFDDFNIDFNKLEYLIETRQSGTLVKPKSAIVLEYEVAAAQDNG